MNVVVNGLMTNYQKTGSGKVVVCLPGWGNTLDSFAGLAHKLQSNYQVLALDLPGFGGTEAPPKAWDLADYARFVADWLEKIRVGEVYAIVGHSYGGAVAIVGLGSGRLSADKLVLLAAAGIRDKKPTRKSALKTLTTAAKIPLKLLPSNSRAKLRAKFYEAIGSDLTLLPHMEPTFKKIISQDVCGPAAKVKAPTLLIYGTEDKSTPPADGRILNQAISGSKLEILPGLGHFLHQEEPKTIGWLVSSFLEGRNV